jgi:hypothetical protein
MAFVSFKLDHLFILLMPELVVLFEVVVAVWIPREPDVVQNNLSIKSKFVVLMMLPLRANPNP